ncbi:hypothetical protein BCR34DRAFT_606326 [Clohesyomyces aquaticus]|uniref:Cardiolipin synthase N-terminal domain-containing protein n=1 Tax=Clohesyomyces aquaticus TaxID=1231657 RepID=A0A1Y1YRN3_9PLEO|nr:hypothetical protein BCR34DRAFT_606326 [Clohesyomyces aquaticus]
MMFQAFLSLLLQFSLMSFASAAPFTTQGGQDIGGSVGGGVIGFIVLVLDIIVFIEVLQSNRDVPHKVLWCLVVFLFPVLGMIIYWLFSNRAEHNSRSGYETITQ